MKLITKLKGLWFFSFVIFGIGVLLDLSNGQLHLPTLFIFIIYSILYFIASKQSDQKTNRST
ncbi:hypothetical protein ACFSO7_12820 [Bacillus sp. CGMCC 1.16607]|uniref:hypothetical protein n=1 Tax=Bacillus sp. CGMCC 1.16607 TaxID=3351842 RepID=UPI003645E0F4